MTLTSNNFAAYYQQRRIPVPKAGLLYYDSLTHMADGKPDYSAIEAARAGIIYPGIAQQTVAGVPCATITASVDEGRLYTLIWQNGGAVGRSQAALFYLGSEPTDAFTTRPIGYIQRIEMDNGHLCNILCNFGSNKISLYDNNASRAVWMYVFTRPSLGAWHLMALTFDSTSHTCELWFDKTRVFTKTDASMVRLASDSYFSLGYDMPAGDSVAHACVYDHALTSDEVSALYDSLLA